MRRVLTLLLVVAMAGGCARKGDPGATPTVPPETSVVTTASTTPPTPAPPDIATIPDVIDEAYLNRVFDALEEVNGRVIRLVVERKDFDPEAAELTGAIYDGDEFSQQADLWFRSLERDPELRNYRRPLGKRITRVVRIITRSPTCVWTEVSRDYSQVAIAPVPPHSEYIALEALAPTARERALNPTAWIIVYEGFLSDGSEPENRCLG